MAETAQILAPDGSIAEIPTVYLSRADVELLRTYKQFLQKQGLREALYCQTCWDGDRHDGCEAHVTTTDVLIRCRCRIRLYMGATY